MVLSFSFDLRRPWKKAFQRKCLIVCCIWCALKTGRTWAPTSGSSKLLRYTFRTFSIFKILVNYVVCLITHWQSVIWFDKIVSHIFILSIQISLQFFFFNVCWVFVMFGFIRYQPKNADPFYWLLVVVLIYITQRLFTSRKDSLHQAKTLYIRQRLFTSRKDSLHEAKTLYIRQRLFTSRKDSLHQAKTLYIRQRLFTSGKDSLHHAKTLYIRQRLFTSGKDSLHHAKTLYIRQRRSEGKVTVTKN